MTASPRGGPGRATTLARRLAPLATAAARTLVSAAAGMLLWTLAPMALGWFPALVVSGSMAPHVMPGDVLVYQHAAHARKGQIILFHDPALLTRLISHRVEKVLTSGTLVTKGDANPDPDDTPIPPRLCAGLARLRVPYIGLPALWWRQHAYPALAATLAAGLLASCAVVPRPSRRAPRPRTR